MVSTKRIERELSLEDDRISKKSKPRRDDDSDLDLETLGSGAGKGQGSDDDTIADLFVALRAEIKNFTLNKFVGAPYNIPTKNQHKEFFEGFTGRHYTKYLKSKLERPKQRIVEVAIWNRLILMLLRTPTDVFLNIKEEKIKD
jgi:hypothetical protein